MSPVAGLALILGGIAGIAITAEIISRIIGEKPYITRHVHRVGEGAKPNNGKKSNDRQAAAMSQEVLSHR